MANQSGVSNPTGTENSVVDGVENESLVSSTGGKTIVSFGILNNTTLGSRATNSTTGSIFGTRNPQVAGTCSIAVGIENSCTGRRAAAFGYANSATRPQSYAIGYYNNNLGSTYFAAGYMNNIYDQGSDSPATYGLCAGYANTVYPAQYQTCIGQSNYCMNSSCTVVGQQSQAGSALNGEAVAMGKGCVAGGQLSAAYGISAYTLVNNTMEIAISSYAGSRGAATVYHQTTGQIASTLQNSASAPTDGGATVGEEAIGTLPRSMYTIQRNGNVFKLYFNDAGTIRSLTLGTVV